MKREPLVALVTGANRGMGLETCRALAQRGYQVILTSRDQQLGQQAAQPFVQQGLSVTSFALDVTNEGSIQHLQRVLEERFGGVDVLVNNAAIYPDKGRSVLEVEPETALRRATAKFERRFRQVEALAMERRVGRDIEALEALWQEVKAKEAK